MTQRVFCAHDAIEQLPHVLSEYRCQRIFLVADRGSFASSGAEKALAPILTPYAVGTFSDFEPNPKLEDVNRGVELFGQHRPDCTIAIGGGTAIDMAKLVSVFAAQPHPPLEYIEGRQELETQDRPLIACPTTAGTGSEATQFAVVYVTKKKYSVDHPTVQPEVAIIDPQFLRQIPRPIAASTGMDALSQAIESYWSVQSNEISKKKSSDAISLVLAHLPRVVKGAPTDQTLLAMAEGAHLAGEAINITRTTAPHAISYPITSYFGVPHGHAVALTLPSILAFNAKVTEADTLDKRGVRYVRKTIAELAALLGARDVDDAGKTLDSLMDRIGLSRNLQSLGIKTLDDIETIIRNGFNPQRVNNNPRRLTEKALRDLLVKLHQRRPQN